MLPWLPNLKSSHYLTPPRTRSRVRRVTLSCSSTESVLCSGRTIQRRVCCAYSLAASTTAEISDMPLKKTSRSPRSAEGYCGDRGVREVCFGLWGWNAAPQPTVTNFFNDWNPVPSGFNNSCASVQTRKRDIDNFLSPLSLSELIFAFLHFVQPISLNSPTCLSPTPSSLPFFHYFSNPIRLN